MHSHRQCAALLMVSACTAFAGCPARTTNSVGAPQDPGFLYQAKGKTDPEAWRARLAIRRVDRESPLSRYYNPEYGLSLRYPRNYILEEGNILEHSYFLKRQEELDLEWPGAQLMATVLIPEDAYPNTTFLHGSLQFVVTESASQRGCLGSASFDPTNGPTVKAFSSEGLQFGGSETTSITAGTQILERDYAAFADGTCYGFYLVIAASEPSDTDDSTPADFHKIMRQLEKIVSSLKCDPEKSLPGVNKADNSGRLESQPRYTAAPQ
jgi:hypothetical protein